MVKWSGNEVGLGNVIGCNYITHVIKEWVKALYPAVQCRQAICALLSQRTVETSTEDDLNSYYSAGLSRYDISLVCLHKVL